MKKVVEMVTFKEPELEKIYQKCVDLGVFRELKKIHIKSRKLE